MINAKTLKNDIIIPTLQGIDLYSESAVNLLLGTCAQESHMGKYVMQIGGGPAMGIYQMEPATYNDMWRYLNTYKELSNNIKEFCHVSWNEPVESLMSNAFFSTAMARVKYFTISTPLPAADDLDALAAYWKKYYNTPLGGGTVEEFKNNYKRYAIC